MHTLHINDLNETRELDSRAMEKVSGGFSAHLVYVSAVNTSAASGPGGPRSPSDKIILPDNPFDIIDMI